MATRLSVINKAVRFLGQDELSSPEQYSSLALSAGAAWEDSLDWCLRSHAWSFAQCWAELAKLVEPPPFYFRCSYQLPADCIRMLDIRSDENLSHLGSKFTIVGRKLYTDIDPCKARYVRRVTDPTFWPSDFVEVVSYKIALDVASVVVPGDSQMRADLDSRFFISLDIARKNDMTEDNATVLNMNYASPQLMARVGEGHHGWD